MKSVITAAVLAAGCSHSASPVELGAARSVVEQALAAWKDAGSVESLRNSANAVFVAEPRWEGGWKLDGYEILQEAADGFQARCKVRLALKNPQGKPTCETAEYLATTNPKRTVTRVSEGW